MNEIANPLFGDEERFISDAEIAKKTGRSVMTLWRWRKRGILPKPVKIATQNYTRSSVLNRLFDELEQAA